MTPEQLDRLEQLAREATRGSWRVDVAGLFADDVPIVFGSVYRMADADFLEGASPTTVLELVAAARLGAAWQEVEAALPEGWARAISIGQYGPGTEDAGEWVAVVVWAPDFFGDGPTPALALLALAEALRGRTG